MNIYVFGLGAIGSNMLLQLIKKYQDFSFYGIDFDKVEDRNMNTQAYFLNHVGLSKAQALMPVIGTKLRKFQYKPFVRKISAPKDIFDLVQETGGAKDYLLLDCFDNAQSRKLFDIIGGNILHVGFSPQYAAEILWHENYSAPNDLLEGQNDICVMTEAIPFINFVVSLAAFAVSDFIDNKIKTNYLVTSKNRIVTL
jgi:hypothetical protein